MSTEYRSAFYPNHTLESFEVQYSPAQWRNEFGGYVGIANWRDEYGQGSRSFCSHKHSIEDVALLCIKRWHEVRTGPYERAI